MAGFFQLFAAGGGMLKAFLVQGHAFGKRSIAAFQRGDYGLQAGQSFFKGRFFFLLINFLITILLNNI